MMEFLDKIYGYENFGIILFIVIAILIVLFLVILFFGKKDEKKRELERTLQLEKQIIDGFANVNPEPIALNINEPAFAPVENIVESVVNEEQPVNVAPVSEVIVEPVTPVIEQVVSNEPVVEPTPVLQPVVEPSLVTSNISEIATPEVTIEPVIEPTITQDIKEEPIIVSSNFEPSVTNEPIIDDINIPDFNFDELAASIAKELNDLEMKKHEVPETVVKENTTSAFTMPNIEEASVVTPMKEVVKPIHSQPVTFSSVYINKPAEPVVKEPVKPAPVITQNPNIELPKPAEMPILNKEVKVDNNPSIAVPDFSQIEGESYNIK